MVQDYSGNESAVHCFVRLLLNRLCFFSDWLFVFPQLRLKLKYGTATVKDAIPDFTVMDVGFLFENGCHGRQALR